MKTNEELNALKEKIEALNRKLHALSDDELETVTGGEWGTERPMNEWESSDGTSSAVLSNDEHQWLREEDHNTENPLVWYGMKNPLC